MDEEIRTLQQFLRCPPSEDTSETKGQSCLQPSTWRRENAPLLTQIMFFSPYETTKMTQRGGSKRIICSWNIQGQKDKLSSGFYFFSHFRDPSATFSSSKEATIKCWLTARDIVALIHPRKLQRHILVSDGSLAEKVFTNLPKSLSLFLY